MAAGLTHRVASLG